MKKLFIINIFFYIFISIALSGFFSCGAEEIDEFLGLIDVYNTTPLDFLEAKNKANNALATSQEGQDLITFSGGYININRWGQLEFSQENAGDNTGVTLLTHNPFINMLALSRMGEQQSTYYPVDTSIGDLLIVKKASFVEEKINGIIVGFFEAMKNKTIDKKLSLYVLKSEIPFISRQISRSVEYAPHITKVRVGKIDTTDKDESTALIRVIKEKAPPYGRADLRFYFINEDGAWLINAIEGDFNILNEPYELPGEFTPLGTTGVTQGF